MFGTTALDDLPFATELVDAPSSSPMICVCCNCDRVRSPSGEWRDDHTPVAGERHTHGICPDCFLILYPEYAHLCEGR